MGPAFMLRLTVIYSVLMLAGPALGQDIRIEDAYARTTARSGAIFMIIVNAASEGDRLISVRADVARSAMLHDNVFSDGVASMRPLPDGLEIPGESTTPLVRGGSHIMLLGLRETLVQGANFPLLLTFEQSGELAVDVFVDNERAVQ